MNHYQDIALGFSIGYPDHWQAVPKPWARQHQRRASPTSSELAEALEHSRIPFFMAYDPAPGPGLAIPSLKCQAFTHAMLPGGPSGLLAATPDGLKRLFADFELLQLDYEYELAGVIGARLVSSMSVKNAQGESFHAISEMLCLPTPSHVFLVGLSATSIASSRPTAELAAIVESIRLDYI